MTKFIHISYSIFGMLSVKTFINITSVFFIKSQFENIYYYEINIVNYKDYLVIMYE